MKKLSLNKKALTLIVAVITMLSLLAATAPAALAWKEGSGTNWWYVDASYGGYHNSVPLVIELNGDPSAGQTFYVGDTVTISGDLHAYAAMCAGTGNEALTDAELTVTGPSGSGSDTAGGYDFDDYECAEVETIKTLTIAYPLTAPGTHTVYMSSYADAASWTVGDYEDFTEDLLTFQVVTPNEPPVCTDAYASVDTIWPPNHKFVAVDVLGVTDPDGDPVSITIDSVYQDEPVDSTGDGAFAPDGQGVGNATAEVRAERDGAGNGRVYHIGFTADDGNGGTCSGEVLVGVPKSQGKKDAPVDDEPLYDSTLP